MNKINFICTNCGKPGYIRTECDFNNRIDWNIPYPQFKLCFKCKEQLSHKSYHCIICNDKFSLNMKQARHRLDRGYTLDKCQKCSRVIAARLRHVNMDDTKRTNRDDKLRKSTQAYWDSRTEEQMADIRIKKKLWFKNLPIDKQLKILSGIYAKKHGGS